MTSASMIKKISTKTVVGTLSVPEKAAPLFTVIGICNGVKTGQSTYGAWLALTGQFEAMNLATGETFIAPQVFLPEPLNGLIAAKVRTPDENGQQVSARFAVEIGYKPSKTTIGYEYTVRELMEVAEADPLADLRKALPAPKVANVPEDAPAKKK